MNESERQISAGQAAHGTKDSTTKDKNTSAANALLNQKNDEGEYKKNNESSLELGIKMTEVENETFDKVEDEAVKENPNICGPPSISPNDDKMNVTDNNDPEEDTYKDKSNMRSIEKYSLAEEDEGNIKTQKGSCLSEHLKEQIDSPNKETPNQVASNYFDVAPDIHSTENHPVPARRRKAKDHNEEQSKESSNNASVQNSALQAQDEGGMEMKKKKSVVATNNHTSEQPPLPARRKNETDQNEDQIKESINKASVQNSALQPQDEVGMETKEKESVVATNNHTTEQPPLPACRKKETDNKAERMKNTVDKTSERKHDPANEVKDLTGVQLNADMSPISASPDHLLVNHDKSTAESPTKPVDHETATDDLYKRTDRESCERMGEVPNISSENEAVAMSPFKPAKPYSAQETKSLRASTSGQKVICSLQQDSPDPPAVNSVDNNLNSMVVNTNSFLVKQDVKHPLNKCSDVVVMKEHDAYSSIKQDTSEKSLKTCQRFESIQIFTETSDKATSLKTSGSTVHFKARYELYGTQTEKQLECDYNYDCSMCDFMKLRYVFNDVSMFEKKKKSYFHAYSVSVDLHEDFVILNLGKLKSHPQCEVYVKPVAQYLLSETDNLTVRFVNLQLLEGKQFIEKVSKSEMAQYKALVSFFDLRNNKVYFVHNTVKTEHVDCLVRTIVKEICNTSTKTYTTKWVLKDKLSSPEIKKKIGERWPSLLFDVLPVDSENITNIRVKGEDSSIQEAMKWLQENVEKQFGVRSVEYKSIPDIPPFKDKHEAILTFMRVQFPTDNKIEYYINKQAHSVWILAEESQPTADEAGKLVEDCIKRNTVVKHIELACPGISDRNFTEQINTMTQTFTESYGSSVKIEMDVKNIKVFGLAKHVNEIEERLSSFITTYNHENDAVKISKPKAENKTVVETCVEVYVDEVKLIDEWNHQYENFRNGTVQIEKLRCVPIEKEYEPSRDLEVLITTEDLTKVKADAIVVTVDKSFDLGAGTLSRIIAKEAGRELQNALRNRHTSMTGNGSVVSTKAFKLQNCRHIICGTLDAYQNVHVSKQLQALQSFVVNCIMEADRLKCRSVALPMIGSGNLRYPKDVVAEIMFGALKTITEKPRALLNVGTVLFVAFSNDNDIFKELTKQQNRWKCYRRCRKSEIKMKNSVVRLDVGSISNPRKNCLIYLWEKEISQSVSNQAHDLLRIAGQFVRDKFTSHMSSEFLRHHHLLTPSEEIPVSNIMHVPCDDNLNDILEKIVKALRIVNHVQSYETVCIGFDKSHIFLKYGERLAETILNAVLNFLTEESTLSEINVLFDGENDVSTFEKAFQKVMEKNRSVSPMFCTAKQEMVELKLTGEAQEVENVISELKKQFACIRKNNEDQTEFEEQLLNNNSWENEMQPPVSPEIDRLDVPPKVVCSRNAQALVQKWDRSRLINWKELERYVTAKLPSKGHTVQSFEKQLSEFLNTRIGKWKLVFRDNWDEAIIICETSSDAKKLLEMQDTKSFSLTQCENSVLGNFQYVIDKEQARLLMDKSVMKIFTEMVEAVDVMLFQEDPPGFRMPTQHQLKYVRETLTELLSSDCCHEPFVIIAEKIKKPLSEIIESLCDRFNFKTNYDDGQCLLTIEFDKGTPAEETEKVQSFIDSMNNRDFDEIQVSKKDVGKALEFCKETDERKGENNVCFLMKDQSKIIVACHKYEDIMPLKNRYRIKIGDIKPSSRSNRKITEKTTASFENDDIYGAAAGKHTNNTPGGNPSYDTSLGSVAKNVKKYPMSSTLMVYVYEADILRLKVDCIVNAANRQLCHAGGVAAVIERAAGYSLTSEGDEYIRRNGNLNVGQACATTAGKLTYRCVIHTVGPEWSEYRPHSLENVRQCEKDLYNAIFNSFKCAERRRCNSIALPAISSAIFRVPEDLCVYQYAKATKDYSMKSAENSNALQEIHFIDRNGSIVQKIQNAFENVLNEQDSYNSEQFVDPRTKQKMNRLSIGKNTYTHHQTKHLDDNVDVVAAEVPLPMPLGFLDDFQYTVLLCGADGKQKCIISKDDIFSIHSSSIVVPINEKGQHGEIGNGLLGQMQAGKIEYFQKLTSKTHGALEGDVILTEGFGTKYKFILHVVIPKKKRPTGEAKPLFTTVFSRMFNVVHTHEIDSISTTLVGTDSTSKEKIELCCESFLESYLLHCKIVHAKGDNSCLRVHLICRDKYAFDVAHDYFNSYVMREKEKRHSLNASENDTSGRYPDVSYENDTSRRYPDVSSKKDTSGRYPDVSSEKDTSGRYPDVSSENDTSRRYPDVSLLMEVSEDENTEDCVICMESLKNPEKLDCGHMFCKSCIEEQFKHRKACPTCGKVLGIITGNQPDGNMSVQFNKHSHCAGYNDCGRIEITYRFFSGKQKENHPNPGKQYRGITRTAYLPDNKEGNEVLQMLKVAFERKLVFTIGISRTTGEDGVITWNDIHHKTDPYPGKQFGYPDADYLNRVKDELSVKGITLKDIQ